MIRLIILGVIVLAIMIAVRSDLRARHRGARIASSKDMKNEAIQSRAEPISVDPSFRVWTDDESDLLSVLR